MDLADVPFLLSGLRLTGEHNHTTDVYQTMLGRSLEVGMGTLEAMADLCRADGHVSADTARQAGEIAIFAPETGQKALKALAFLTPARTYVTVLHYDNPVSKGDLDVASARRFANNLGQVFDEAAYRRRQGERLPELQEVTVHRAYNPFPGWGDLPTDMDGCARAVAFHGRCADPDRTTLEGTLREALTGKTMLNQLLSARRSRAYGKGKDKKWMDGLRSCHDIAEWPGYFETLHAAIPAMGLVERFKADAQAMSERQYDATECDRAKQLGDLLARLDGYLPRAAAVQGTQMMWRRALECGLAKTLDLLTTVHAQCRANGHTDADSEFDHNDMDDFVFAPDSGRADLDLLGFRDQTHQFLVAMTKNDAGAVRAVDVYLYGTDLETWFAENFQNGISADTLQQAWNNDDYANPYKEPRLYSYAEVLAVATGTADPAPGANTGVATGPAPIVRLSVTPDGVCTVDTPFLDETVIVGWTRLIGDIETAECCLDEEYGALKVSGGRTI